MTYDSRTDTYVIRRRISRDLMASYPYGVTDYLQKTAEVLKHDGAIEIFEKIYSSGTPVVVETHLEGWDDCDHYYLDMHYRITAVSTHEVMIPVFKFVNHEGKIEWKCPACGTINIIEATYCGEKHDHAVGCGRPRDKVRQAYELQA